MHIATTAFNQEGEMIRRKRTSMTTIALWLLAVAFVVISCIYLWPREEEILSPTPTPIPSDRKPDSLSVWRAAFSSDDRAALTKAASEIELALESGSVSARADALLLLASIYKKMKSGDRHRATLERIIREFPNTNAGATARAELSGLSGKGVDLYFAGQYELAIKALSDRLLTASPDESPEILFYIARCHDGLGANEKATEAYNNILEKYPDSQYASDCNYRLAALSFSSGAYEKTLAYFRAGLLSGSSSEIALSTAALIAPKLYAQYVEASQERSKWDDLREIYCALWLRSSGSEKKGIESKLTTLNEYVLFSPHAECSEAEFYTVVYGDSLGKIARKFGVSVSRIMRVNRLKSEVIHPDQRLKILKGRATLRISKSGFTLTLLLNNKFVKSYRIGIGKGGVENETPIGQYKVTSMDTNPTWYKDGEMIPFGDPRNILGTRWIGINVPHYGIHGTSLDDSIGKASSAGCIRMHNGDVEELYDYIAIDDPVVIED